MEQTILVTGSTSGFGRLMVETLARQDYRVFAAMRAMAGKNAATAEALRALAQREMRLAPRRPDPTSRHSISLWQLLHQRER